MSTATPASPAPSAPPSPTVPEDDLCLTFALTDAAIRGRVVRLGPALDRLLGAHNYPAPVARLLAEATVTAVLLGGMLKYEGVFTLQTKGDGPVNMLVADVTSAGALRGYAQFDPQRLERALDARGPSGERPSSEGLRVARLMREEVPRLLGKGYLAFTVDQGQHTQRYQGIVDLAGDTLQDCVHHYFSQSDQVLAHLKVAVGEVLGPGGQTSWRAGGLIVQRLPEDGLGGESTSALARSSLATPDEPWERARVLTDTLTDAELVDPDLAADQLIWRLFNQEEPRAWPPQRLEARCRCSPERVETVIKSLAHGDITDLTVDGRVTVTCEFCSTHYHFDPATLQLVEPEPGVPSSPGA